MFDGFIVAKNLCRIKSGAGWHPQNGGKMLSVCGVRCSTDCKAYQVECDSCPELLGKVSWAVYYGAEQCPIYACATAKGLTSCGECGLAPCPIWYDTRNPDATDAEFAADLASRLHNLYNTTPDIK